MSAKPVFFSPSILSADFTCLRDEVKAVEEAGADWIHVDVMDGHFVPNLTMGPFIVEACRRITSLPIDVHLMIEKPESLMEKYAEAGANLLYVHVETCPHLNSTLQQIRSFGCKTGVVLNPSTPAASLDQVLYMVDYVLVMTVNPGFSGQTFIPEVIGKIRQVRKMLDENHPEAIIAVDGGITSETLPLVAGAGAQFFIASNAIYKHPQGIMAGMQSLRASLREVSG
jgi:ribulose-phosphate 3-epimerase